MAEVLEMTGRPDVPANAAPPRPQPAPVIRRGPGEATADELARSRELHPSRRPTPEQQRLQESVDAQRVVGRELAWFEQSGDTVFHGVRVAGAGIVIDHVVVTRGGVFVVVDVPSDRKAPIAVSPVGGISRGDQPLDRLAELVGAAARNLATGAGAQLPVSWSVVAVPVLAVAGRSRMNGVVVSDDVTVIPLADLRTWMTTTFPGTVDRVELAQLAAAVEGVCV